MAARKFTQEEIEKNKGRLTKVCQKLQEAGAGNKTSVERFIDKPTIARAVKQHCWECCGYNAGLAKGCEDRGCALWSFGLAGRLASSAERAEAGKEYGKKMASVGEYDAKHHKLVNDVLASIGEDVEDDIDSDYGGDV